MAVRSFNAALFIQIIGGCLCFSHAFLPAVPGGASFMQHRSGSLAWGAARGVSSGRGALRAVGRKLAMRDELESPPSAEGTGKECQAPARGLKPQKPAVAEGRKHRSAGGDGGVNTGRRRALGLAGAAAAMLVPGQPAATQLQHMK